MSKEFLLFLGLFLVGLAIRIIYEQLKKAKRITANNKVAFILVFLAMCLMWASWFNMCPLDPLHLSLPASIRWIGFALVLAGLILAVGALVQLKGVENIKHLVTTGLFSKIRHPMYIGFILWITGWSLYHGAALSLIPGFLGIISILYWRKLEEHELESRYGEEYRHYRAQSWF